MADYSIRFHTTELPLVRRVTDNFGKPLSGLVPMPQGGGIDPFGGGIHPSGIGTVTVESLIYVDSRDEVQEALDTYRGLQALGTAYLFRIPQGGDNVRFIPGVRLVSVDYNYAVSEAIGGLKVALRFEFQCPIAYWLELGEEDATADEGFSTSDPGISSLPVSGGITTALSPGVPTLETVTNNGPFPAHVRLSVTPTGTATSFSAKRNVPGTLVGTKKEEVFYDASFSSELIIDTRLRQVTVGGTNEYENLSVETADWLRLLAGSNGIVYQINVSAGSVSLYFYEYYRS